MINSLCTNEVRNGMDIPTSIMELVASRITKDHAYRILLHADPYSFHDAVTLELSMS